MKTKDITQDEFFKATPQEVYDALMDSKKHAEFTGASAKIDNKVGGNFTAWDGYIKGENLELVPGKKIVQSWNADEDGWPADHYSKVTYELSPAPGGTNLHFTHTGLPEDNADDKVGGWIDHYWKPMKKTFGW